MPLFTNDKNDYKWIRESVEMCCDGVDAKIGWHFCFGNAWGNDILSANYPQGYQTVLPYFFGTAGIDEFVLDYANRDMAGVDFLKKLPGEPGRARSACSTSAPQPIEKPEAIADRIRRTIKHVPAEKVTLSTDCGMKPLARMVSKMKLKALADGADDRPQGDRRRLSRSAVARTGVHRTTRAGGDTGPRFFGAVECTQPARACCLPVRSGRRSASPKPSRLEERGDAHVAPLRENERARDAERPRRRARRQCRARRHRRASRP